MPTHYAFSELFLVFCALWGAFMLWRRQLRHSSLACLLFALAAGVGAYRFGVKSTPFLTDIHRSLSQIGGVMAMAFIAVDFWRLSAIKSTKFSRLFLLATLVLVSNWPNLANIGFVLWAMAAAVFVIFLPVRSATARLGYTAVIGFVILNVLLVRQAAWLSPAESWHVFHVLMGLWLYAVAHVLTRIAKGQASALLYIGER